MKKEKILTYNNQKLYKISLLQNNNNNGMKIFLILINLVKMNLLNKVSLIPIHLLLNKIHNQNRNKISMNLINPKLKKTNHLFSMNQISKNHPFLKLLIKIQTLAKKINKTIWTILMNLKTKPYSNLHLIQKSLLLKNKTYSRKNGSIFNITNQKKGKI